MVLAQKVEMLTDIISYQSGASVYNFVTGAINDGEEFDQSYTLTGATIAVQGRDYGYDPLGTSLSAPMGLPRKTAWKFLHKYGANETYDTLKDAMTLAFGHGRLIYLQKKRPDGKILLCEARLSDFPDRATTDSMWRCEFTVTFEQRGEWFSQEVAHPQYDSGLLYDHAVLYDLQGVIFTFSGQFTNMTFVNSGTINEKEIILRFDGPITGPFNFVNYSCDVRGVPAGAGLTSANPMYITVNLTLASGEHLTIDTRRNTVESNHPGIVPWQVVTKAPGQRFYFEVVPGNNTCQMQKSDSAASGDVYAQFHNRYRS